MKSRTSRRIALTLAAAAIAAAPAAKSFAGTTVAAAWAAGTTGNPQTLNNVEVVGVLDTYNNTNTFVLQDSTGSIIDYEAPATGTYAYTPTVGDIVNVTLNNSNYQDGAELKGSSTTAFSLVSSGNAVSYPVLTIPQFNAASGTNPLVQGSINSEAIVTLDNVTFATGTPGQLASGKSYTITDGTNNAVFYTYGSFSDVKAAWTALNAAEPGGVFYSSYDMTGYVSDYFGTSEFELLSATPVAAVPTPAVVPAALASLLGLGGLSMARRRRSASL
jgi:hypothetical protein